jgi:hypothetical protein
MAKWSPDERSFDVAPLIERLKESIPGHHRPASYEGSGQALLSNGRRFRGEEGENDRLEIRLLGRVDRKAGYVGECRGSVVCVQLSGTIKDAVIG